MQKHSFKDFVRRYAGAFVLTAVLFALVYNIVVCFKLDVSSYYSSDFFPHLVWAIGMSNQDLIASFYDGSEHLWHILVYILFYRCHVGLWIAAGLVTAFADAAAYFLTFCFFDSALPRRFNRLLLAVLLFCVYIASAVMLPGLYYYYGVRGINPWHNPTNIMVRPFAAAVFYMTVRIYNRRRFRSESILNGTDSPLAEFTFSQGFWAEFRKPVYSKAELILYPLCLLLSCYAKPSFMQCFAPGILIFLLIDVIRSRGKLLPFCIKLALSFIPAAIICCIQFFGMFDSVSVGSDTATAAVTAAETVTEEVTYATSGIAVYFIKSTFSGLGDFLATCGSTLWNIFRLLAFPLIVFLAAPKKSLRSTSVRLVLIITAAAFLERMLLHETGSRAEHDNFGWAYYLSVWLTWSVAVLRYSDVLTSAKCRARNVVLYAGTPVLIWHIVSGILYIIRILQTSLYYF